MSENIEKKTAQGVFFKLIERTSVQVVSLFISIVLARLLLPEAYGKIAMANIFIEVCNVFVNYGFGTAVIHKKNVTEKDLSTCFWSSLVIAAILYIAVYFGAPIMADYYAMPVLTPLIRVMGIQIFLTSINSVQIALVSRQFRYKQLMIITLISSVVSGAVGIFMAYKGFDVWSLAAQSTVNVLILTLLLAVKLKWLPKLNFSFAAVKEQFVYSWKLLVVGLVDCVYAESRNLIIAKKYSSADLAYYNKATQFPKLISNTVNQTVISVLFPSMSMLQDDNQRIKQMVKKSLSVLTFVIFPVLLGLCAVSDTFVEVLLTEKWLDCVPYLRILCVAYMIAPMQSVYKQSFKAMDKNKILLITNLAEKLIGLILLVCVYSRGVSAIAVSFVAYHIAGLLFYMIVSCKMLEYKISEQLRDILANLIPALIMAAAVFMCSELFKNIYISLCCRLTVGVAVYLLVCIALKNNNLKTILQMLFKILNKKHSIK